MTARREPIMDALMSLLASSIASSFTGATTYGSAVVTGIASTTGLFVGLPASSQRVVPGTTIASIDSATQITLSASASSAGSATFTTGFLTVSRRLKIWRDVAAQPALFVRNADDTVADRPHRMPARLTMNAEAWVYNQTGPGEANAPSVLQNYLLDALCDALEPATGVELLTLGGLVHNCWIEGTIERHPGDLDGQAIAIIPISILLP